MNTAVTAKGMSVTAKTDGGLAIGAYTAVDSEPASTDFVSSASAIYNDDATILPVSFNGTTWYTAKAANANSYAAEAKTYSSVDTTDLDSYRLISKFQVKSMDTASDTTPVDLYVTKVKISGDEDSPALDKSLRVAISINSKTYYFAPLYETLSANLYYCSAVATDGSGTRTAYTTDSTETTKTLISYDKNKNETYAVQILDDALTTTAMDLDIYIYYEGEDENCRSTNAVNIDTLNIEVTFSTTV